MKARSFIAVLFAATFAAAAEPISVGAVNCGAFHYGKAEVTEGEYAAGWEGLAADNPADLFFYEAQYAVECVRNGTLEPLT